MSIRVTNVQRMCFDDGPGIRTTVFMKGCSLHCPWCSNPENIRYEKQEYSDSGQKKRGIYGRDYEPEELLEELMKDRKYWGTDGGVTFSGGEALLQAEDLEPVWKRLKAERVHLAVETALFVPEGQLDIAAKYIDYFYVDVKLLDQRLCRSVLGGDLRQYLNNMERLAEREANIHFRVPCSGEYTLNRGSIEQLLAFFSRYPSYPIEIFSIHDMGNAKYKSLGSVAPEFRKVTEWELEQLKSEIVKIGCNVEIIKI